MRLTSEQQDTIYCVLTEVLEGMAFNVSVFGSRVNDAARGGDLDLLIETENAVPLMVKARINHRLQRRLNLPVDVVFLHSGQQATPFQNIALQTAEPLEKPHSQ